MKYSGNLTLFLQKSDNIYHIALDAKGDCTYANPSFCRDFPGQPATTPRDFRCLIYPKDRPLLEKAIQDSLCRPEEKVEARLRVGRNEESYRWLNCEFYAGTVPELPGSVHMLAVDTTAQKNAEAERREAQERLTRERYLLRTLIDNIPDYISIKDVHSRHIINNKASLELMGAATEEETLGRTVIDYFDDYSARQQLHHDQDLIRSGIPAGNIEEVIVTRKGKKKWLLTTKVPLRDQEQKVIGLVSIGSDITERKQIEESLRKSIERYNIVSKATNDAIWDWNLETGLMHWNDMAALLFGYSLEEMLDDKHWWHKHIHPDDRDRVLKKIYKYLDEGMESWQDEYRFICADGSCKFVLDRGYILSENGKPFRMIGAMMDITDRKRLEEELALQHLSRQRQVTEAAILAQEKERAEIGRELHDNINQILTTTKMYLDMALTEKDIAEELTLKSHENISTVIEEIRTLSKSLVPPSLGDIGLKEALSEMVANLKFSQKIDIRLRATGIAKASIPGDTQLMIFRIVQEQVNNILKHSKATEAEIRLAFTKNMLTVTVSDNGIGFDPKKRNKGIGLMNITSRAEVHKGKVEIISSPGKGCSLKISIPI